MASIFIFSLKYHKFIVMAHNFFFPILDVWLEGRYNLMCFLFFYLVIRNDIALIQIILLKKKLYNSLSQIKFRISSTSPSSNSSFISHNRFFGEFPTSLTLILELYRLTTISHITHCEPSHTFVDALARAEVLRGLHFWLELSNLYDFNMSENRLTGVVPGSFARSNVISMSLMTNISSYLIATIILFFPQQKQK